MGKLGFLHSSRSQTDESQQQQKKKENISGVRNALRAWSMLDHSAAVVRLYRVTQRVITVLISGSLKHTSADWRCSLLWQI